jgi:hypothetical protein
MLELIDEIMNVAAKFAFDKKCGPRGKSCSSHESRPTDTQGCLGGMSAQCPAQGCQSLENKLGQSLDKQMDGRDWVAGWKTPQIKVEWDLVV